LLLYAVHGTLHLCGHDDRTAREYRIMHRTEDDLLTRLGVGPVFAASPPESPSPRRRKVR
jgi:ssRNA-specific RNase YbeY (16S rRNA maturation enzyme)